MFENINTLLGIIVSLLSIGSLLYSKKNSDKITKIEKAINQNLQISVDSSKKSLFSSKKAVSGEKGTSIIGDNNSVGQDDKK